MSTSTAEQSMSASHVAPPAVEAYFNKVPAEQWTLLRYLKRKRRDIVVLKSLDYEREYAFYEAKINSEHNTPLRERLQTVKGIFYISQKSCGKFSRRGKAMLRRSDQNGFCQVDGGTHGRAIVLYFARTMFLPSLRHQLRQSPRRSTTASAKWMAERTDVRMYFILLAQCSYLQFTSTSTTPVATLQHNYSIDIDE
ncbi:10004_t:CDS:1 [Paraglomus occultum]|uniref:10004_t:CDS:1 n=1 Tax=Paraglomus occultum TaxID=144539 RepID=A0A9N9FP02_9GLOM|nr:10004_t:CDS:1 [Paraglomus occultum]